MCANFGLPRPLCSRLFPMYGTDRRHHGRALQLLQEKTRTREVYGSTAVYA